MKQLTTVGKIIKIPAITVNKDQNRSLLRPLLFTVLKNTDIDKQVFKDEEEAHSFPSQVSR